EPILDERELSIITTSIVRDFEQAEQYTPAYIVAKQLKVAALTLSRLTSSLFVLTKNSDQRVNIGLSLKFDAKNKKVLGYTRKNNNVWEFSVKAIQLLQDYKAKFPEIFAGLDRKPKSEFFNDDDFFEPENSKAMLNKIKDWLKEIGIKESDRVTLETTSITKEYIAKVEDAVQKYNDKFEALKSESKWLLMANVPRQAVLKPAHAIHKLSSQSFNIGDRVTHVPDTGSVPLGARGTVVGLEENLVNVVFDEPFLGGFNLDGRCSELKGMTLPKQALLNLTNQQLLPGSQPPNKISRNGTPSNTTAPQSYRPYQNQQYGSSNYSNSPNSSQNAWRGAPQNQRTPQATGNYGSPAQGNQNTPGSSGNSPRPNINQQRYTGNGNSPRPQNTNYGNPSPYKQQDASVRPSPQPRQLFDPNSQQPNQPQQSPSYQQQQRPQKQSHNVSQTSILTSSPRPNNREAQMTQDLKKMLNVNPAPSQTLTQQPQPQHGWAHQSVPQGWKDSTNVTESSSQNPETMHQDIIGIMQLQMPVNVQPPGSQVTWNSNGGATMSPLLKNPNNQNDLESIRMDIKNKLHINSDISDVLTPVGTPLPIAAISPEIVREDLLTMLGVGDRGNSHERGVSEQSAVSESLNEREGSGGGLQQHEAGYQQRQQRGEGYQHRGEGYQQRGEGYQQRGEGYQQRGEGYQQRGEGYQQRGEGYREGYQPRGEGYQQRGEGYREGYQPRGEGYQQRGEGFRGQSRGSFRGRGGSRGRGYRPRGQ
ncbi:hypothetical protein HK096_004972, partial [Nowakowskiella sp. JEL0078]